MNTIHRNCFEIVDKKKYLHYLQEKTFHKIGGLKKHNQAKFLLHANSFGNTLSKDIYAYNDDYFLYDEELNLIKNQSQHYMYRKDVFSINHNSIKFLLKNNIIRPLEENPAVMAKINLLYK